MESKVIIIKDITGAIDSLKHKYDKDSGIYTKGSKFNLTDIKRAPGSGKAADLIAHQQGVFQCDDSQNYVITGSVKNNPSYFYLIKNGKGCKCNAGKDYWPIETTMTHPGGIQVAENILAIGNEQYIYGQATTHGDRSNIRFFDIGNESSVFELDHLFIERQGDGKIASAVALTKNGEQWVLAVRAKEGLDFYCLDGGIQNEKNKFSDVGHLDKKKYGLKDFQTIQLFPAAKPGSAEPNFYLFGMPEGSSKTDKCWIYKLNFVFNKDGKITHVSNASEYTTIHFVRDGTGPRFKWGAGVRYTGDKFEVTSIAGHVVDDKIKCNRWV